MVTLEEIRKAQQRLAGVSIRTPLVRYEARSGTQNGSGELFLKLENLQPIGSFKLRGAYNKIASLSDAERARGVITYSSGNHAQGVAYAARTVGTKATVVMPRTAPAIKAAATKQLGAEIEFVGPASSERQARADELAGQNGYCVIPPFNDPQIRKAMALALDRKAFIDILSNGKNQIAGVMLPQPEGRWGMPPDLLRSLPGYAADVEKSRGEARKIMEGLGYSEAKPLKVKVSTRNVASAPSVV